jgi:hypothetical protein
VFAYETRSDQEPDYLGGSLIKITHRLKSVTAYSAAASVRRYDIYYDNAGYQGRSRLTSVVECGSDGVCLPATTFAWRERD